MKLRSFILAATFTALAQSPALLGQSPVPYSGVRGSNQYATASVPQDTALLIMDSEESNNADPDGDLYYEGPDYTGSSTSVSNFERITRENPMPGSHRMRVYGYSDYSGFRLRVRTIPYRTISSQQKVRNLAISKDQPAYFQIKLPADSVGSSFTGVYGMMIKLSMSGVSSNVSASLRMGTDPRTASYTGSLYTYYRTLEDEELVTVADVSKTYYLKVYNYSDTPVNCAVDFAWHSVSLASTNGAALVSGRETWIASHGRDDNPTNSGSHVAFQTLVNLVAGARTQDGAGATTAATLDWSSGARDNYPVATGLQGSQWITPAAKRVAKHLKDRGFNRLHLNLIGHSWGTLIVNDLANYYESGSPVARLVALDPAENIGFAFGPDGDRYNEWGLNFSSRAHKSVSLFTPGGLYGDEGKARTAHISIGLSVGAWMPGVLHAAPVDALYYAVANRRTSLSSGVIWRHIGTVTPITAWSSHYSLRSWWFAGGFWSYCNGMLTGTLANGRFNSMTQLRLGTMTYAR